MPRIHLTVWAKMEREICECDFVVGRVNVTVSDVCACATNLNPIYNYM